MICDYKTEKLFSTEESIAIDYIKKYEYPWEILPHIKEIISEIIKTLSDDYMIFGDNVFVHKSAVVAHTAMINGPAIICENAEIRHSAFIRGNVIVGKGAVVGNSTELKNVILFNSVQVPHYNYVGDSIIGFKSHMGAGAITSNVKSDKKLVVVKDSVSAEICPTGLKKMGAVIGDNVEVGCGSVLNPGTIIGQNTNIYPLSSVRGCIPAQSIYKNQNEVVLKQ